MKIEVRPIDKKKWHGHTGENSFTRPVTIRAFVNGETRQYDNGLNYVDKTFNDPSNSKTKLTEAEYYGLLLKADLSSQYKDGESHPFWDGPAGRIKLENHTMTFDTNIPLDYIKIKIMKQSPFVANSLKEFEEGLFPEATHVITDEAEEIEEKAGKVAIRNKTIIECSKLSKDRKIQIILILDGKNLKGQSDNFVEVELNKLIDKDASEVLRYINMDVEDTSLHALILEALQKSVLRKEGHKYLYFDSVIGNDIYDVIDYLKSDENQDLKLRIMSAVN